MCLPPCASSPLHNAGGEKGKNGANDNPSLVHTNPPLALLLLHRSHRRRAAACWFAMTSSTGVVTAARKRRGGRWREEAGKWPEPSHWVEVRLFLSPFSFAALALALARAPRCPRPLPLLVRCATLPYHLRLPAPAPLLCSSSWVAVRRALALCSPFPLSAPLSLSFFLQLRRPRALRRMGFFPRAKSGRLSLEQLRCVHHRQATDKRTSTHEGLGPSSVSLSISDFLQACRVALQRTALRLRYFVLSRAGSWPGRAALLTGVCLAFHCLLTRLVRRALCFNCASNPPEPHCDSKCSLCLTHVCALPLLSLSLSLHSLFSLHSLHSLHSPSPPPLRPRPPFLAHPHPTHVPATDPPASPCPCHSGCCTVC